VASDIQTSRICRSPIAIRSTLSSGPPSEASRAWTSRLPHDARFTIQGWDGRQGWYGGDARVATTAIPIPIEQSKVIPPLSPRRRAHRRVPFLKIAIGGARREATHAARVELLLSLLILMYGVKIGHRGTRVQAS